MGKNIQNNGVVSVTERTILASQESENNCIGLMLKDRENIPTISSIANEDDYFWEGNTKIVKVILDLYDKGSHIDPITVSDELKRRGELEAVGGTIHLYNLSDLAVSASKAEEYAKRVQEWAAIRQVKSACEEKIEEINTGNLKNPVEVIDGLTRDLHTTGSKLTKGGFTSTHDIHDNIYYNLETARELGNVQLGIPTGIAHLDNMTGGLQRGDYIVLGARTSVGKTAFAIQLAAHCAIYEKQPAAIFSLEMTKEQLMYRMISGESGVSATAMRKGDISNQEWERVKQGLETLKKAPIFIDETTETTVLEIKSKIKKLIHKVGPMGIVVIDYINLIRSATKFDNTYSAVGEISRDLKAMAKELNIALVVLAQLNRNTEGRADKMPSMSDIADSDKIPRDADLVMLLYRNSYYSKKSSAYTSPQGASASGHLALTGGGNYQGEEDRSAVLLLDKNRNGATGLINLEFDKKTTKFTSASNY